MKNTNRNRELGNNNYGIKTCLSICESSSFRVLLGSDLDVLLVSDKGEQKHRASW